MVPQSISQLKPPYKIQIPWIKEEQSPPEEGTWDTTKTLIFLFAFPKRT